MSIQKKTSGAQTWRHLPVFVVHHAAANFSVSQTRTRADWGGGSGKRVVGGGWSEIRFCSI